MKILIVDDSKAMRLIVSRTLRQAGFDGYALEEATNGLEGLAAVRRGAPDLVLSDWNMPEMTGIEFLEALGKEPFAGKFCFVTSESTDDMRERAKAAGATAFITKPFTADVFRETLTPLFV